MKTITITNDFHRTETTIRIDTPWTKRRARDIKRRLCGISDCTCSDELGARGKQDPLYYAILDKATCVIMTGRDDA